MKKLFPILGMVCGVICCILAFVMMGANTGSTASSASFGADFYTYSVKATAAAANNVHRLTEALAEGIGYLLLAIGLTDICLFGCKLAKAFARPAAAVPMPCAPQYAPEMPQYTQQAPTAPQDIPEAPTMQQEPSENAPTNWQ